ncbi:MAG TPA: phosphoribosylpyrophosphate synthetase [Cyclobacteriaceae bacterium]
MKTYESLVDALADLKKRGYKEDFKQESACVSCYVLDLWIAPEQFNVDEIYRFEANSNPDDNSVLYAISSYTGIKGTLVDAYGVYAESMNFRIAQELEVNYRVRRKKTQI